MQSNVRFMQSHGSFERPQISCDLTPLHCMSFFGYHFSYTIRFRLALQAEDLARESLAQTAVQSERFSLHCSDLGASKCHHNQNREVEGPDWAAGPSFFQRARLR